MTLGEFLVGWGAGVIFSIAVVFVLYETRFKDR